MPNAWRFDAIGTRWEIETEAPLAQSVRGAITAIIGEFDRTWSRFRDDSMVAELAASGGRVSLPSDAVDMFEMYVELADATDGAVNPLVGEALARRGYDAGYSLVDRGAVASPEWRRVLSWDDASLTLRDAATIDVGALGKGRLVDLVMARVEAEASGAIIVDASGDLAVRGGPVRIALEHPYDRARAIGVFTVTDAALCASAINRRAWGDGLHHVLDARTGVPVRQYAATWAVAPDAMRADAAATALFFDGGPELAARWGVDWVRMTTDGRVEWAPNSTAEVFS